MYTVFESGADEPLPFALAIEQYDIQFVESIKERAVGYYSDGMVRRALREFKTMREYGDALENKSVRMRYVQLADEYIARCDAKIREFDERNATRRPRAKRKI
ncbi:MAG: hypothetical protein ABIA12_02705 [Candidatus Aenigmatarchaeota archaeon]